LPRPAAATPRSRYCASCPANSARFSFGPGRDGPCGPPPGQNPASGFPAPGSHLRSTAERVLRSLADPLGDVGAEFRALGPVRVSPSGFPVGRAPSLHRLPGRYPRVRRLLAGRYYERVRLLRGLRLRGSHPYGLRLFAFPCLPPASFDGRAPSEVSRFPCMRHVCACRALRLRRGRRTQVHFVWASVMAFREGRARRPPHIQPSRSSITRPAHSAPYASPRGSPHAAQGLAFPGVDSSRGRTCSTCWCCSSSLTCFLMPVSPGASALAVFLLSSPLLSVRTQRPLGPNPSNGARTLGARTPPCSVIDRRRPRDDRGGVLQAHLSGASFRLARSVM